MCIIKLKVKNKIENNLKNKDYCISSYNANFKSEKRFDTKI